MEGRSPGQHSGGPSAVQPGEGIKADATSADVREPSLNRRRFVEAANANHWVQEYRRDGKWWSTCWSEENIAKNPLMRVEFEYAIFFGALSEAISMRRGKESWGRFVRVEPLHENDVLHPTRVVYILKATSRMRQRWEWRDTMKQILGKNRYLVGQAVRQTKKEFVGSLSDTEKKVLRAFLDFTPEAFWQASRFGERRGPNSIHEFVRRLEERTKGYRLNFNPL